MEPDSSAAAGPGLGSAAASGPGGQASSQPDGSGASATWAADLRSASDPTPVDVSVVIVNYNVREFLEQALESVRRASRDLRTEVFVVDNNSVDGSVPMVRERFPEVLLIANDRNVGFGVANNMAISRAQGRYTLILNPDTIVQEDTFQTMAAFMDTHPEAGAVGCQILNPDGTFAPESRRSFPTPQVGFWRMTGLGRLFPSSPRFGRYNMTFLPRDQVAEVDALSGSCMMVRTKALRGPDGVGLFDEDFFMYGEDLDLCYRIQQAGWKIYYIPDTQIIHYKGESTKKGELRYVRLFYGAMVLFTRKHLRGRYSLAFASLLQGAIMLRAGISVLSRAIGFLRAPATDFALVFGVVGLLGWLRSVQFGADMSPLFLTSVAPAFGIGTVSGILLAGGYQRNASLRVRPVLAGLVLGFLVVSAVSFFAKSIAFSRVVLALSLPLSAALLVGWRLAAARRRVETRRAIVVGDLEEATRLAELVSAHPRPPFLIDGYVEPEQDVPAPGTRDVHGVQLLGATHHLRDLVRLHQVNDVVFAVKNLTNQRILGLMQTLQDLPVQFRMLGEDRSHVIGKSNVSELGLPDWTQALSEAVHIRSRGARRAFEIPASILLLVTRPLLWSATRIASRSSLAKRLLFASRNAPDVLLGRRYLVGVDPSHLHLVPEDWRLQSGVFNITQLLQRTSGRPASPEETQRAYWFYATHQSAGLDLEVIFRAAATR